MAEAIRFSQDRFLSLSPTKLSWLQKTRHRKTVAGFCGGLAPSVDEFVRETLQTLARLTTTPLLELRQLHVECLTAVATIRMPAVPSAARVGVDFLHLPEGISHDVSPKTLIGL